MMDVFAGFVQQTGDGEADTAWLSRHTQSNAAAIYLARFGGRGSRDLRASLMLI